MATTSTSQHNDNTVCSSTKYSASFKPFDDNSSNHTKDELESNLEAISTSSGIVTDTKEAHNDNTDVAPNTSKSKEIDDFLSKFSSKSK